MTSLFGDQRAPDISDHVPRLVLFHDGSQRARCEACGWLWPCSTVSSTPAELTSDEKEIIEVLEIGVGFFIWRRMPDGSAGDGGVVIGWQDDDERGRIYTTLDFLRGRARFARIAASEISPIDIGMPNSASIRGYVRHLAGEVAKGKGAISPADVELLEHAFTLSRAL